MRETKALLDINLRLFDGAAAGGAATGGEGAAAATTTQTETGALPKADIKRPGSSRRGRTGEFDNVVFGKQTETDVSPAAEEIKGEGNANTSGVSVTSNTLEDKVKAFEALIDGEYKDQFAERVQQIINRRFKDSKAMEQSLTAQKPIIDMLMQRYNIGDNDLSKLQEAIDKDDVYWEDAAEKAGFTIDQYKAMLKLQRENAELKMMRQRQQANQQMERWYKEAEDVKNIYPSFDFRTETANRDFMGLLRSGVGVQKAYELMHMEEIKEAAAKSAAQAAGMQVVAKLQNKAARPLENGTSSQSAAIVKNDVSNLSRAERAEIARRVQRGDKITF